MKRLLAVCMLATLTSTAFYAQNALAQSQSAYSLQQNDMRNQQSSTSALQRNDRQTYVNSVANLTKLRAKLAEAWQTLGMSPQAAQAVANAYQPDLAQNAHHASLRGKSGQEVASMLQSALAKKDYALADQMLIEYEQIEAKLGANVSPDSHH